MPNNLDFATWNFSNVQLAPAKLKLVSSGDALVIGGDVAAEAAARQAADTAEAATRASADLLLQVDIDEVSKSYAHSMLLGGM